MRFVPAASSKPVPVVRRFRDWTASIRFRLTLMYSAVLFGLAAMVVAALYVALSVRLQGMSGNQLVPLCQRLFGLVVGCRPAQVISAQQFAALVHQQALEVLRTTSFAALGLLFCLSLVVGWVISGRVLAPIGRITETAREIQATDLSRRIALDGPQDELKQLADTIDALIGRIEAAFAEQQRFVADASHELRNPLAVIRTNLDVALADPDAPAGELRHAATVVRGASDRMARLVDDLLALARHQAPTARLERADLSGVLLEAVDEFARPAARRGVEIQRRVAAGLAVAGDRDAIKRVFANLLENAIRYAPAGTAVGLTATREDGTARVEVTDQGPGIEAKDQASVFERFWRADPGRARSQGGSGLGLAIVRQVVEAHGGTVELRSVPGAGATFVVRLPAADPAREGSQRSGQRSRAPVPTR